MIESKPVCLCVGNRRHRIKPVERKLCLAGRSYSLRQALVRKGGLIIGEGDTGKSTYVQMLCEAAARRGGRKPLLVKLRTRPTLTVPDVSEGEVQTIVWDGLDEFPECARDIIDLTADLDPERYHVWVTSRPCNAASVVAASPLLEDVYHLVPFAEDDFRTLKREWFHEDGGDMGEFLSGVVVKTKVDHLRAATALGVAKADSLQKLSPWSVFHLPDCEGYPVQVSYETHFDPDDSGPTDSGGFSILD